MLQGADFFNGHVESIYGHFAQLTPAQVDQFKQWYHANNDVEKICANDPAVHIARYADIRGSHRDLSEELAVFFKGLYSQQLLNLAALKEKVGDIDDHYNAFMEVNKVGKCPFCGMADMQGVYHTKREAYDHYLPKGLYPFNSINFHNLVPACHLCNSSYKTSIALSEEIETWKDIYGIDERYKAKCCGESDGKYWLQQILDEWTEDGRSPADFLNTLTRLAIKKPYADNNFLKKAFLDGCDRTGLFNVGAGSV